MKEKKEQTVEEVLGFEIEKLTQEEAETRMNKFFGELEEKFKDIPEKEMIEGAKKVKGFVEGNVSWAELMNFPPDVLYHIAKHGYAHFRSGRYENAEKIFKVLSALDINNPHYHVVMGAILQRQNRHGEAVAEYGMAIELDSGDITALVNRGEIYLRHSLTDMAKADFDNAIKLDKDSSSRWAARARLLLEKMEKGNK